MKLALTNREAQRLFIGLRAIDAIDGIKLSGKATLNIAINLNRLTPVVAVFERAINKLRLGLQEVDEVNRPLKDDEKQERKTVRDANKAILIELEELADTPTEPSEIDLITFKIDALKIDENPKIRGDHIASIAAIVPDFDKVED